MSLTVLTVMLDYYRLLLHLAWRNVGLLLESVGRD